MTMGVAVVIASDSRSSGERADLTGPAAVSALKGIGIDTVVVEVVQDELAALADRLTILSDNPDIQLIFTCGGTGLAPRDVTPEATSLVIEKEVPGIPEMIRQKSLEITPKAALSRAVAGIRNRTLIVNLPGSPKAVVETIGFLAPLLPHAMETVAGLAVECATPSQER